jgi:hypothetical protein
MVLTGQELYREDEAANLILILTGAGDLLPPPDFSLDLSNPDKETINEIYRYLPW